MSPFEIFFFFVVQYGFMSVLEFHFFCRYSGGKPKKYHYILYIALLYGHTAIELQVQSAPLSPLFLIVHGAILFVMGILLLKGAPAISALAAIIAVTVSILAAGVLCPIALLLTPLAAYDKLFPLIGILPTLLIIVLTFISYQIILKKFAMSVSLPNGYFAVFLIPVFLVLIIEQYILNQVYGNEIVIDQLEIIKPIVDNWQMLFIQVAAYLSLFSVLYACQKLSEGFFAKMQLALMEQEVHAQRDYLQEAQSRYRQTRSFRHDIKSHLLALDGLLKSGELEKARTYLRKLEEVSSSLSFSCHTGNIVVDTLLNSKLSVAHQEKIQVECAVRIPEPCAIDDLDLCVVFSNGVDNAVKACGKAEEGNRHLRISGKQKGDFFMLEIENSCGPAGEYEKGSGIGLSNIKKVAEKYKGAVTAEMESQVFKLSVLLIIPRQLDDI